MRSLNIISDFLVWTPSMFLYSEVINAITLQGLKLAVLSLAVLISGILRSMLINGVLQKWPYLACILSKMD